MKKVTTANWKVGLLNLIFAVSTIAGAVLAQENAEPAPGFIGKDCSLCRYKRWTVEQFANP
jgi:hypothetical protein